MNINNRFYTVKNDTYIMGTCNRICMSLGLLLLSYILSVDGDIVQCFIGGITSSDCQPLINVSKGEFVLPNSRGRLEKLTMKTLNFPGKNFESSWKYVLSVGTDLYKLKFHSKLVALYKENVLSSHEEYMVFLKSCYNAASTYYLTNNNELSMAVLDDGLDLLNEISDDLLNSQFIDKKEVLVWSILLYTLKVVIMKAPGTQFLDTDVINKYEMKLSQLETKLDTLADGKYPSPYILMYRGYFLDETFDNVKKTKLDRLIQEGSLTIDINHTDYESFDMYSDLIKSLGHKKDERNKEHAVFNDLLRAATRSIWSTEDRLLNYKANALAMEKIKDCINEDGWINESDQLLCHELGERFKKPDSVIRKRSLLEGGNNFVLVSYIHQHIFKNILEKLKSNLASDRIIDENILRTIVSESIDLDPEIRKTKIETVKLSINELEKYIKSKNLILNEKKKKNNEDTNTNVDIEEAKKNTLHTIKNIILANKWLAELYGILCDGTRSSREMNISQTALENALHNALYLSKKSINLIQDIPDEHLYYLVDKHTCRKAFPLHSWESKNRPDGWVLAKNSFVLAAFNFMSDNLDECCDRMIYQKSSNHPFVNNTDVLINVFRCKMKKNVVQATQYLRGALSNPVINCEDRFRNIEAHELYSIMLVKDSSNTNGEDIEEIMGEG